MKSRLHVAEVSCPVGGSQLLKATFYDGTDEPPYFHVSKPTVDFVRDYVRQIALPVLVARKAEQDERERQERARTDDLKNKYLNPDRANRTAQLATHPQESVGRRRLPRVAADGSLRTAGAGVRTGAVSEVP